MLRINLHQDGRQSRLELAGKLCGPWLAKRTCLALGGGLQQGNSKSTLERSQVLTVPVASFLVAMHHAGARLIAKGVWMTALIEEIIGEQSFDRHQATAAKKESSQAKDSRIRRDSK